MYFSPAFILTCLLATSQAASFQSAPFAGLTIDGKEVDFKSKVRVPSLAKLDCSKMKGESRGDLKAYLQANTDQVKQLSVECVKALVTVESAFLLKHGRCDDIEYVGAALCLDLEKNPLHLKLAKKIVNDLDGQEEIDDEVMSGLIKSINNHKELKALASTDVIRLKKFLNPTAAAAAPNVPQAKSAKSNEALEKEAEATIGEWEAMAKEAYENPEDAIHQLAKSALPLMEKYGPSRGKVEAVDDFLGMTSKMASDNAGERKQATEEAKKKAEELKNVAEEKAGAVLSSEKNRVLATSAFTRGWTLLTNYFTAKKEEGDAKQVKKEESKKETEKESGNKQ